MRQARRAGPWPARGVRAVGRLLLGVARVVFLVLIIFMPIPLVLRPNIPKPVRRNLPSEVMRQQ